MAKWPRPTDESLQPSSNPPSVGLALPPLNYNIWDPERRKKLLLVVTLLVIESGLLPIALYYTLWFKTNLNHGALFAIITSFFGFVSGIEFALRSLKLLQRADTFRPLGGKRWHFDFSHLTLSAAYTVMTGVLIGASIPSEPIVPALALPLPYALVQIGLQMVVSGILSARHAPAPFRISSVPKGARVPPLVYTLIEDIVAVDGSGTKVYRAALQARYEASPHFRTMIAQLNWFWGVSGFAIGVALIAVIWTIPQEAAYGVGWGAPLVFAFLWTAATIFWARRSLRLEREMWYRSPPEDQAESGVIPMQEQGNTYASET